MDELKAIEERWENGYQRRANGGWCRVRGQPDPRADVRALVVRVRELEVIEQTVGAASPIDYEEPTVTVSNGYFEPGGTEPRRFELLRELTFAHRDVMAVHTDRAAQLLGSVHVEDARAKATHRMHTARLRQVLFTGTAEEARLALELHAAALQEA